MKKKGYLIIEGGNQSCSIQATIDYFHSSEWDYDETDTEYYPERKYMFYPLREAIRKYRVENGLKGIHLQIIRK